MNHSKRIKYRNTIEVLNNHSLSMTINIMSGLDCDQLPNGFGKFGTLNNPIPVNGIVGEKIYLNNLRGLSGQGVKYLRTRSTYSKVSKYPIDEFVIVCNDGSQMTKIYFDMYHPRRSNITPDGFTLNNDRDRNNDYPIKVRKIS